MFFIIFKKSSSVSSLQRVIFPLCSFEFYLMLYKEFTALKSMELTIRVIPFYFVNIII